MKTINKILKDLGYTKEKIKQECKKIGCNGCGGKGGFNFTKFMSNLPYFENKKGKRLLNDLTLICNLHDIWFYKGGGFIDYIKANYKFARNVFQLLYWTNGLVRVFIFVILLLSTTMFGFRYFNWKKGI